MEERLKLFETKITDIVKQQEDFRCQVTELTTRTNDVLKNNRETNEKVRETSEAINVHEERIVNIEKQLEQLRTQQAIEMEEIKRNVVEKQADNLPEPMQIDNGVKKVCLEIESACRMENVEQNNRRDCLQFYGIYEHENENTTTKVIETAAVMGIFIEPTDVSISHRLATRNRARSQPKPIIAKFVRREVKNNVYQARAKLRHSVDHYNVFIREQLTEDRSKALYMLRENGYRVTTTEGRLNVQNSEQTAVINSLLDLQSKQNWSNGKMEELFKK